MMHKRLVIRAPLPPAEDVGARIKATVRWVKRQAIFDAMLAEVKGG